MSGLTIAIVVALILVAGAAIVLLEREDAGTMPDEGSPETPPEVLADQRFGAEEAERTGVPGAVAAESTLIDETSFDEPGSVGPSLVSGEVDLPSFEPVESAGSDHEPLQSGVVAVDSEAGADENEKGM